MFGVLSAESEKDFVEEKFDLEDLDRGIGIALQFCLKDKVTSNPDSLLIEDCYAPREGDLNINFDEDRGTMTVQSDELEMHDADDDDVGNVAINFTFKACEGMADAVAEAGE